MITIGFLINPIAGMGGAVGLKGTDGLVNEAIQLGARPVSGSRAEIALSMMKERPFLYLTCSGPMGQDAITRAGISRYRVVYQAPGISSGEDTQKACKAFLESGADIILFCGGDGTALDIYESIGNVIPVLGIPAGVKMFSAVFATSPEAAADMLLTANTLSSLHLRDAEIMDVDEEAYRDGELRATLHGYIKSPYSPGLVQEAKQVFENHDEDAAKASIARFLAEVIEATPHIIYILGPGSTTKAIADDLGVEKTLLGFDAIRNKELVGSDMNEQQMLLLLSGASHARLVVSVIGAQGSVLGRGTQQVSPEVLRKIGIDQIIVIATPSKLAGTPFLFIDTGDRDLDDSFGDYISVISGYRIAQRKKLSKAVKEQKKDQPEGAAPPHSS
jgi:predicted polyphosphate/ATP-dependent NAD kinase